MIKQSLVFFTLLLVAITSNAKEIPCPSVFLIQSASKKINTVIKVSGLYTAYTKHIAFIDHHLYWKIEVNHLKATSHKDALKQARKALLKTTTIKQKIALMIDGIGYHCAYGPFEVHAMSTEHKN